jgi:hypothetical protein
MKHGIVRQTFNYKTQPAGVPCECTNAGQLRLGNPQRFAKPQAAEAIDSYNAFFRQNVTT